MVSINKKKSFSGKGPMSKSEVIKNTYNAFEFVEKLYLESTYLIKEIEGMLAQEPEEFVIGRPRGYQVTAMNSNGLEQKLVSYWMTKKLSVFFVPKDMVKTGKRSQTITTIEKGKKVFYLRILLHGDEIKEPEIWAGVIYDFSDKYKPEKPRKFEEIMMSFESYEKTYFAGFPKVEYEDAYIKFKGNFISNHLYNINTSEDIKVKIIDPALTFFRNE